MGYTQEEADDIVLDTNASIAGDNARIDAAMARRNNCKSGKCGMPSNRQAEWKRQIEAGSVAYRDHRGSLRNSMSTMQRFDTEAGLREHIVRHYGEIQTLEYEHIGMDDRIGWDTWYVLVNGMCVGMTNGRFNDPNPLQAAAAQFDAALLARVTKMAHELFNDPTRPRAGWWKRLWWRLRGWF